MFSYGDERMDISASGFDDKDRELLGRRTYKKFETTGLISRMTNRFRRGSMQRKNMLLRPLKMLHWNNSTLLHGLQSSLSRPNRALTFRLLA